MPRKPDNSRLRRLADFRDESVRPPKVSSDKRVCRKCHHCLPLEAFGDRRDGVCLACDDKKRMEEREAELKEQAGKQMDVLLLTSRSGATALPKLEELCTTIIAEFGSMPQFVRHWKDQFDQVKPTVGKLNHIAQIWKLIATANEHRQADDIHQMNMEQLDQEQNRMILDVVMEMAQDETKKNAMMRLLNDAGVTDADENEGEDDERVPTEMEPDREAEGEAGD